MSYIQDSVAYLAGVQVLLPVVVLFAWSGMTDERRAFSSGVETREYRRQR
jgi:hypothetical protein